MGLSAFAMTVFHRFPMSRDDEGPFTLTQPIHTHYYTPRDHNDGRNKRIWFNIDEEQPCCRVLPFPRESLLVSSSSSPLDAVVVALAIMANVSTSRPQRPHMYDYMGLVFPFSPFSPLSGRSTQNKQYYSTMAHPTNDETPKNFHTSRLTFDFFTFFVDRTWKKLNWLEEYNNDAIILYLLASRTFDIFLWDTSKDARALARLDLLWLLAMLSWSDTSDVARVAISILFISRPFYFVILLISHHGTKEWPVY